MDYKRGKPAKTRKGRPSVAEVKSFIDKREDEKKKIRLSSLESKITEVRKNSPKLKNDSKSNFKDSIKKINSKLGKLAGYVRRAVVRIGVIEKKLLDIEKIIPPKKKLTVIDKRLTNLEKKVTIIKNIIKNQKKKLTVSDKRLTNLEKKVTIIKNQKKKLTVIDKRLTNLEKKVTIIKNIIKNQQSSVGQKSNQDNLYKTLVETNKLLLDIQKELVKSIKKETKDSGNRQRRESLNRSKKKLKEEESILEKSGKVINEGVKKVADKMLSPIKNIFDKVIDFLFTLGTGIVVNAVFKWLKDDKNREKIDEWFGWIKNHWKWVLAGLGAIALIPVITTIASLVTTFTSLITLAKPLFAFLVNPVTLTVLGTLAAVAAGTFALGKAVEWGIDKVQKATYGEGNVKKGIFATKLLDNYGRISSQKDRDKLTDEEKNTATFLYQYDQMLKDRQTTNNQLFLAKNTTGFGKEFEKNKAKKIDELEKQLSNQDASISIAETQGVKIQGKNLQELFNIYSMTGALPTTSIQARQMGGPVTAGKPYLVGERGPELYVPNFDGKIINNLNTEKIYNIISSKKKKVSNIKTMELPPIFNNDTNIPEVSVPSGPATKVPSISSFDASNPYIKSSLDIYGIMV